MQDVVPPANNNNSNGEGGNNGRKSIRNVPLPKTKQQHHRTVSSQETNGQEIPQKRRQREVPRWGVWSIAIASVVVVVFAASTLFTSATVVISPKQASTNVSVEVTAQKERGDGGLLFETITVTADETEVVNATKTETVSTKAQGRITVYNDYSTQPMNLVATTRFEAENGAIYRSPEPIRIPGRTESGPGKTTITVVAAEEGASYNLTESEFSVPGLKGDPSFDDVYAVSAGPISGGATGERKVISSSVRDTVRENLQTRLEASIESSLQESVPEGYVLFSNLKDISYNPLAQNDERDGVAELTLSASVTAPVFPKTPLTNSIMDSSSVDISKGEHVMIQNLSSLTFTPRDPFDPSQQEITGTIHGQAVVVWDIDEDRIKEEISGKDKSQLGNTLSAFSEIQEAKAQLRPFWVLSFPTNPNDITVKTTAGETEEGSDEENRAEDLTVRE